MRLFLMFLSILTSISVQAASPAPPIGRSKEKFEESIRATYGLTPRADVREFALHQEKTIQEQLRVSPDSPESLRDLGDIYHTLGHLEEYDDNFEAALNYHQKAIENFQRSHLKSKQSGDKLRHSIEHIFVDMYEQAYKAWQNNDSQNEFMFRKAIQWARRWDLASSPIIMSPPVRERYIDLVLRAPRLMIQPTVEELSIGGNSCDHYLAD